MEIFNSKLIVIMTSLKKINDYFNLNYNILALIFKMLIKISIIFIILFISYSYSFSMNNKDDLVGGLKFKLMNCQFKICPNGYRALIIDISIQNISKSKKVIYISYEYPVYYRDVYMGKQMETSNVRLQYYNTKSKEWKNYGGMCKEYGNIIDLKVSEVKTWRTVYYFNDNDMEYINSPMRLLFSGHIAGDFSWQGNVIFYLNFRKKPKGDFFEKVKIFPDSRHPAVSAIPGP